MEDWKAGVNETMRQLGQSRTARYVVDHLLPSACPPWAQLDAYYRTKLTGPPATAVRQHLIICDRCTREILLREQITADLIDDESMEWIQEAYATDKSALPAKPLAPTGRHPWFGALAERKVFVGVAVAILFLLFLLFLWALAR